jgi:hypothetical protein
MQQTTRRQTIAVTEKMETTEFAGERKRELEQ